MPRDYYDNGRLQHAEVVDILNRCPPGLDPYKLMRRSSSDDEGEWAIARPEAAEPKAPTVQASDRSDLATRHLSRRAEAYLDHRARVRKDNYDDRRWHPSEVADLLNKGPSEFDPELVGAWADSDDDKWLPDWPRMTAPSSHTPKHEKPLKAPKTGPKEKSSTAQRMLRDAQTLPSRRDFRPNDDLTRLRVNEIVDLLNRDPGIDPDAFGIWRDNDADRPVAHSTELDQAGARK